MAFIVSKINKGLMGAMRTTERLGLLGGWGTSVSKGRRWGVSGCRSRCWNRCRGRWRSRCRSGLKRNGLGIIRLKIGVGEIKIRGVNIIGLRNSGSGINGLVNKIDFCKRKKCFIKQDISRDKDFSIT